MNGRTLVAIAAGLSLLGLKGCVRPGGIDSGLVTRYQQAMARRGPQKRARSRGPESLRPVSNGPMLKVVQVPGTGKSQVHLRLDEAVQRALANSLDIRVVSFEPAISREEVTQAAAAFDLVAFGGFQYKVDDNLTDSAFSGGHSKERGWNAGIKKKSVTGANWQLEWAWTRTWDDANFRNFPTRHDSSLRFEITQPLLRDGWRAVNLATLRVARINHRQSLAQFRQKVEEIVGDTIIAYWGLVQARRDVKIQESLLRKTRETLKRITDRGLIDATKVQIKQAESAVESRNAVLIRARKTILDAQDRLARLLADKQINLLSQHEIIPTTPPSEVKVEIDPTDRLVMALRHNAVLEQARLAIDVADITVRVAKNQALPRLDLTASTGLQGLGPTKHGADRAFYSGEYLSYAVGLSLEVPLGNRERRAEVRKRRLERLRAIATLQNLVDQVAVEITNGVRQIHTTFEELRAQRAAVEAASVQLQALEDTERIRGKLSPEFLQVKLQAQETLADNQRAELQAVINYNAAMTDLARLAGTILDVHHVKLERVVDDHQAPPPLPKAPPKRRRVGPNP